MRDPERKSMLDDMRGLLGDDRPPQQEDWFRKLVSSWETYAGLIGAIAVGILLFIAGVSLGYEDPKSGPFFLVALALIIGGGALLNLAWQQRQRFAAMDQQERLHQQSIETIHAGSRGAYLDTLSRVEIAQLENQGRLTDSDRLYLEQREAQRVRDWQSREAQRDRSHRERESAEARRHERQMTELKSKLDTLAGREIRSWQAAEAALDRQATIEQMLTRFEGKIRELEVRMEYESPSAQRRTEELTILMRACLGMIREINDLPNNTPEERTYRKQAFDQFKVIWKA